MCKKITKLTNPALWLKKRGGGVGGDFNRRLQREVAPLYHLFLMKPSADLQGIKDQAGAFNGSVQSDAIVLYCSIGHPD